MTEVFLLLGSNLEDPAAQLKTVIQAIEKHAGKLLKLSSVYWSAPWGKEDQPAFLNQVVHLQTPFTAFELLALLLDIEKKMGRQRLVKWGSRIIDIDILYYGKEILTSSTLKIPHPEIANRRFVLTPLSEIAPDFLHPVLNISTNELLKKCSDKLEVRKVVSDQ